MQKILMIMLAFKFWYFLVQPLYSPNLKPLIKVGMQTFQGLRCIYHVYYTMYMMYTDNPKTMKKHKMLVFLSIMSIGHNYLIWHLNKNITANHSSLWQEKHETMDFGSSRFSETVTKSV